MGVWNRYKELRRQRKFCRTHPFEYEYRKYWAVGTTHAQCMLCDKVIKLDVVARISQANIMRQS